MKKRDDKVYLDDILESIDIINRFIGSLDEKAFTGNLLIRDAIIRRFEIIGEAASKISAALKHKNKDIKWGLMKDMRNKLIHEYFGISPATIYYTVKNDLPFLKKQIRKILRDLK